MARVLLAALLLCGLATSAMSALTCAQIWTRCSNFCKNNGGLKRAECNDDGSYSCDCNSGKTDSACAAEEAACSSHCGSNNYEPDTKCSARYSHAFMDCECERNPVLAAGKTFTLPGGTSTAAVAACKAACGTTLVTVCVESADERYEVDQIDCKCGYANRYTSNDEVCYA